MTKPEIIHLLKANHQKFIDSFSSLDEQPFATSVNGKWAPGQQLDHIIKSVRPVVLAFGLPHIIATLLFGKVNRPSRSYEALVEKYQNKLAAGGKAPSRFESGHLSFQAREESIQKLDKLIKTLIQKIDSKTDEQLDNHLLPHPLLGKITFREMAMFTAYHAEHHQKAIVKNLA